MKHRIVAMLLSVCLLLSLVPPVALAQEAPKTDTGENILTAFSAEEVEIDGKITDDGWRLYSVSDAVSIGAQWQKKVLYLAFNAGLEGVALTVNGKTVDLAESGACDVTPTGMAVGSGYVELALAMADLGLTKPPVGTVIPVTLTAAGDDHALNLELSAMDWFAVENPEVALKYQSARVFSAVSGGAEPTENQGTEKISGGYRMFDLYDPEGSNPASIRNYIVYQAGRFAGLHEHDQPIYTEMELNIRSLPVYDSASVIQKGNKTYPVYGLNILVADAYDDPSNSNYWSTMIRTGICNMADGLNLVALLDSGTYEYVKLPVSLGERFRLGLYWAMDGSLTVSVDGTQVASLAGVETSLHWYASECISLNMIRSETAAASAADDMDVSVTNLAVGKYYDPYTIPTVVAEGNSAAAYASTAVTLDGSITEAGWLLNNTVLDDEGDYAGKFGAQWDETNLYLALETAADTAKVEFGRTVITLDMQTGTVTGETPNGPIPAGSLSAAAGDGTAEVCIPLRVMDILKAAEGELIPVVVRFGEAAYSGQLILREIAWFLTDLSKAGNPNAGVGNIQNSSRDKSGQGTAAITGGYQLYDKYVEGVSQYGSGRTYAIWHEKSAYFNPLNDLTLGTYTEFELHAENMPVWTDAQATHKWAGYAARGLTWHVGNTPVNNVNTYTSMAVYNTADGLKLVVLLGDNTLYSALLGKSSGDKFRIGTMVYPDGSLNVYVNGELLNETPIANALCASSTVVKGGIAFNLFQIEKTMVSSADDLIVSITGVTMAKQAVREDTAGAVANPSILEAAYTADAVTLDGKTDEAGWLMNNTVGSGKLGAQWDANNLYLALDAAGEEIALTVNGKTVTLDDTNSASDAVVEAQLSLKDLGVTVYDYGTPVPFSVTVGDAAFTGSLSLIAADWVKVEKADAPITADKRGTTKAGSDNPTNLQGYEKIDGGYRLYDLWDPAGENPTQIRTYLMKIGPVYNAGGTLTEGDVDWVSMGEHQGTWLSFDFRADSLPEYKAADMAGLGQLYPCYGLSFYMTDKYNAYGDLGIHKHNVVAMGIFNSVDGLMLTVSRNSGTAQTVALNRQEGDAFRVSVVWLWDEIITESGSGSLVIYIDGEYLTTVEDAQIAMGYITKNHALGFNLIRSKEAADSLEDDMDVSVTNIAGGKLERLSLMELLDWAAIRGENTDPDSVTSDLVLPQQLTDGILTTDLRWSVAPEGVIGTDGKVTIPDNLGEPVTLTATLAGTGASKSFEVIVPGTGEYDGNVTVVAQDKNPADGMGEGVVAHRFTLDENNNSIVLDLGEETDINLVTLTDSDAFARLRRDNLTLWYWSEADGCFRQTEFLLKHDGVNWYLYGFGVSTRYIKVHSTHYDGTEADFVNAPESMIAASWDASLEEKNTVEIAVPETTLKDQAVQITLPEGIAEANLRVSLNGSLLYHYVEDGKVFLRIPDPTQGQLKLWNGSADSLELSNKEYVYEVSYGTREAWAVTDTHWMQTLNNGTTVGVVTDKSAGYDQKAISYSYDGGLTWSDYKLLDAANEGADETQSSYLNGVGNFIYDTHTGRLILHGQQSYNYVYQTDDDGNYVLDANDKKKLVSYDLRTNFIASDDNGVTWYKLGTLETPYDYVLSYTAGLELSTYDGDGPNVDFVFSLATWHPEKDDGTMCTLVAYSTDAGDTWQLSDGYIATERSTNNASGNNNEGGASEATVMERDDGTLVLYARYQAENQMHFAVSHSYDHGITWETGSELGESGVYTTNTQPMFYSYNGDPLLIWGGNNAVDRDASNTVGKSYIRTPMSVGVTYDGGETFGNIQDLYAGYSMQGLTFTTQHCIINPMVQKNGGDSLLICYWDQFNNRTVEKTMLLRVDDFTDFFYRSKGVYDSFEHGTVKYEGWDVTAGSSAVSDAQKYDGSYSMMLQGATAARSVPYLSSGTVSMQVYPTSSAGLTVSLQAAYSNVTDRSAPVNVVIPGDKLNLNAWNEIVVELALDAAVPTATLYINGEAEELTVNTGVGNYVCFITMLVGGTVYVDDVLVVEAQDAVDYAQSEAGTVMQKIASIGTVTLRREAVILAAREAYEDLTDEEKVQVTNLAALEAAEDELERLKNADPAISFNSISLKGNIALNYYLTLNAEALADEVAYMQFTVGEEVHKIPVSQAAEKVVEGNVYYVFTWEVAAKEMNDTVTGQFFYGDKSTEAKSFSVRAYADTIREDTTGKYDAVKPLVEAMLHYGAYAQQHFGYNTGNLANEGLDAADIGNVSAETLAGYAGSGTGTDTAVYCGNSLLLKSETSLRFFFRVAEGETLAVTCGGKVLTATERNGMQYVAVENIAAKDLDTAYTLTVNGVEITASALTYAYNVLSAADGTYDDNLENLVKALYLYNQAANTYFEN